MARTSRALACSLMAPLLVLGCNAVLGLDERPRHDDEVGVDGSLGDGADVASDDTKPDTSQLDSALDSGVSPPSDSGGTTDSGKTEPIDSATPDVGGDSLVACPASTLPCAGGCVDVRNDATSCGSCGKSCMDGQYCVDGKCQCRPYSRDCGFSSGCAAIGFYSCSACSTPCPSAGKFLCDVTSAACVDACPSGTKSCIDGIGYRCVDVNNDAFNCGGCGVTCKVSDVCTGGACRPYQPATGCTSCPCGSCPVGTSCCPALPRQSVPICVKGSC